jgi:hypothetical protein
MWMPKHWYIKNTVERRILVRPRTKGNSVQHPYIPRPQQVRFDRVVSMEPGVCPNEGGHVAEPDSTAISILHGHCCPSLLFRNVNGPVYVSDRLHEGYTMVGGNSSGDIGSAVRYSRVQLEEMLNAQPPKRTFKSSIPIAESIGFQYVPACKWFLCLLCLSTTETCALQEALPSYVVYLAADLTTARRHANSVHNLRSEERVQRQVVLLNSARLCGCLGCPFCAGPAHAPPFTIVKVSYAMLYYLYLFCFPAFLHSSSYA